MRFFQNPYFHKWLVTSRMEREKINLMGERLIFEKGSANECPKGTN